MKKRTGFYPRLDAAVAPVGAVGHAGGVMLTETVRRVGLDVELSAALERWRKPTAVHDPAKVICDLAMMLVLGGCFGSDLKALRAEPELFGRVASNPTVSRLVAALAGDADRAIAAINGARAAARRTAWRAAGAAAPRAVDERRPLIVDIDGTLVTAHSEKEKAAGTFKRGFGFHPLTAFVDHGPGGTGEPLAIHLRPGNAGSNTAADHIQVAQAALAQLPGARGRMRRSRKILIRTDGGGGSKKFIKWCADQHLGYSIGFTLPGDTANLYALIPETVWTPALDSDGGARDGADVAEFTGLLNLTAYPNGMRVIVRRERPHPGAQLRFDDVDGYRLTAFVTNTRPGGPGSGLADLELRHRLRARCEDRIKVAKDTGLANLPLQGFDQNQIWCHIIALACDLQAWMQTIAFRNHPARRWEPKKLRYAIFNIAATISRHARKVTLKLSDRSPWADDTLAAINVLRGTIAIE